MSAILNMPEIVDILLTDSRVSLTGCPACPLLVMCNKGLYRIVERLLTIITVDDAERSFVQASLCQGI